MPAAHWSLSVQAASSLERSRTPCVKCRGSGTIACSQCSGRGTVKPQAGNKQAKLVLNKWVPGPRSCMGHLQRCS